MAYPADLLLEMHPNVGKAATDAAPDPALLRALDDAANAIIDYCGRIFVPTSTTARRFDARASSILDIDDLLSTPAPVVVVGVTPLTAGTDYQLLPQTLTALHPHYEQIRRLDSTGQGQPWNSAALAAPRPAAQDITITGAWGWDTTVPGMIERATIRLATILFQQRSGHQGRSTGTTETGRSAVPVGLIEQDDVLVGMLRPYKKGC